ncbi:hypothetical protein AXF42_Ash001767 [Apostasia shenzhenica]|uniref:Uncharacterized protein n=1 Tax=Apostasia shenzhenica TaxID=1088818 RepID=A0A2I0AB97_9ASPA|nr:hypothetical protein AXF42_Ash001767 [Apostasia shenzhenica]
MTLGQNQVYKCSSSLQRFHFQWLEGRISAEVTPFRSGGMPYHVGSSNKAGSLSKATST